MAAVHRAHEHSVFSDDLIDLAGLHTWADFVDSCHQSESCSLTIFMLDEESQGIGPCQWFGLATQMLASERPGACHCESSSGLLPAN